jgi:two-component system OmpR family response regulator
MRSKEILVVDDDIVALKILESVLNGAGYSVVPVANGRRAIEAAKERPPDLVILDIMMPDMDGGDAAHVLFRG